ncbi:hypothetical protein [Ectopseudomonas mendocina]|uniref:hypothetical protein n=1 Tax=Ectopseudomonas mendocina TaxID=300 RepID=UPI00131A4965|nr:hypothetical protein [Pseudomonas mendocina]
MQEEAYFLGIGIASGTRHANAIYFEDICSIRSIRDHYAAKGMDEDALYEHIKGILEERYVRWGHAV